MELFAIESCNCSQTSPRSFFIGWLFPMMSTPYSRFLLIPVRDSDHSLSATEEESDVKSGTPQSSLSNAYCAMPKRMISGDHAVDLLFTDPKQFFFLSEYLEAFFKSHVWKTSSITVNVDQNHGQCFQYKKSSISVVILRYIGG
jgi:hypothetical protein